MILVIGTVRLPESGFEKLLPAAREMMAKTRTEDGCISYAYSRDLEDPDLMHISEKWRDQAALAAHFQVPHMAVWREAIAQVGLLERDLKSYESDDGTPV